METSEVKKMAETFAAEVHERANGDYEEIICTSIRKELGDDYCDDALDFALAWIGQVDTVV